MKMGSGGGNSVTNVEKRNEFWILGKIADQKNTVGRGLDYVRLIFYSFALRMYSIFDVVVCKYTHTGL